MWGDPAQIPNERLGSRRRGGYQEKGRKQTGGFGMRFIKRTRRLAEAAARCRSQTSSNSDVYSDSFRLRDSSPRPGLTGANATSIFIQGHSSKIRNDSSGFTKWLNL